MAIRRPSGREDFEIGIICALPLEYNAVSLIFDEFWDEDGDPYGRAAGDHNNYTTGRIGKYNVVLALLSHMGKTNATSAAHSLRLSYSGLRFVFLVGICGGVPRVGAEEILLGDVVISKTIVQYDFGRRYPDEFLRKDTVEDNVSKPNKEVRNLLVTLETDRGMELLYRRTTRFLKELQEIAAKQRKSRGKYNYPGTAEDKLFESHYTHGIPRTCECIGYGRTSGCVCNESFNLSCEEVGCDKRHLVPRERLEMKRQLEPDNIDEAQEPAIYVGPIASGDTVMKSGEDRDRIARKEGVIAFEMEAAGVWEELPCCIVVKGVCDYADSHKNKKWQNFAAATASSVTKVLLERLIREDKPLAPAIRDERADASNMLQNSCLGCNIARLQQGNNVAGLPESNLLTILMSQLARGLPPQIKHQDPVTVIDARNRPIPFFLDTIGSVKLFTEVLKEKFKDLGLEKIKRGEWYLEDHYTGQILNLTKPWESLIRPGQLLDMTMVFRGRNISSTQCPACCSTNFGDPKTQVTCHMCALTYRRIEEIQEIPVLKEDSQPQPRTAVPQATPKGEHKVLAPLPRPRPLKPQSDDDDISHYSRVQIIDTSFQIQKAGESKIVAGIATLSVQDLDDPERLAAYLATVCGLPEEDCLVALRECETQLLAMRAEFGQPPPPVRTLAVPPAPSDRWWRSRTRRPI